MLVPELLMDEYCSGDKPPFCTAEDLCLGREPPFTEDVEGGKVLVIGKDDPEDRL